MTYLLLIVYLVLAFVVLEPLGDASVIIERHPFWIILAYGIVILFGGVLGYYTLQQHFSGPLFRFKKKGASLKVKRRRKAHV